MFILLCYFKFIFRHRIVWTFNVKGGKVLSWRQCDRVSRKTGLFYKILRIRGSISGCNRTQKRFVKEIFRNFYLKSGRSGKRGRYASIPCVGKPLIMSGISCLKNSIRAWRSKYLFRTPWMQGNCNAFNIFIAL